MEFGGRYRFATPREAVWRALNDTEVLRACIPGCRRIEWTGPDALELEVQADLGPLHPVFRGELTLSNVVPAMSYTLSGRGKGGLLGLAHASADIALADAEGGSEMTFTATGGASGRIMQLGRALIGERAQAIIDGFFIHFGEVMGTIVTPLPARL
jgi:carbon monoxide dehydrogenase subunit G